MTDQNFETDDRIDEVAADAGTPTDQRTLASNAEPEPGDGPADPWSFDLPPEVCRLAEWIIGTGLFPDPERAGQWLWCLEQTTRPWLALRTAELQARALAHFTAHLTGADEEIRRQRDDVRRALEALWADPYDDNPILAAGCGTVTAAQVAEMENWFAAQDTPAQERRVEELRALFEADEAYQERLAEWRADGWELLPAYGSTYRDMPCDWFVGKEVKVGFQSNWTVEHMWVAVKAVKGRRLVGVLLSEPAVIRSIQSGDRVELKRCHVESVA